MGATLSVVKVSGNPQLLAIFLRAILEAVANVPTHQTLIVPAVVSLILFLVSTYLLLPLWRRYRQRYSNYLPLDTISDHTSSFRHRVQGTIGRFLVPSAWRQGLHDRLVIADDGSDADFESEDGEELGNVGLDRRSDLSDAAGRSQSDNTSRLSRE